MLDDASVPDAAKHEAAATAADYYHLAWQYTQSRQGQLILMSGLSGSGKSTIARQLARKLGAIQIRSDAVRKHLGGIPLTRGGSDLYTAEMSQKTYERLLELRIMLATQGFPVILDAKYDRQQLRLDAINQAQSHHLPLQIVHCTAPLDVLRDRLGGSRTGDITDATVDLLEAQAAAFEPFTEAEKLYVKTLDTSSPVEDLL